MKTHQFNNKNICKICKHSQDAILYFKWSCENWKKHKQKNPFKENGSGAYGRSEL